MPDGGVYHDCHIHEVYSRTRKRSLILPAANQNDVPRCPFPQEPRDDTSYAALKLSVLLERCSASIVRLPYRLDAFGLFC